MKILICITELNYILKYIIYIYIYICKSKYNLTQRRAKTPHMTGYRTSEHNEKCTLKDLPSFLQNGNKCSLYFCKRKYCENININGV